MRELAQVFARFGVQVTLLEAADRILANEEPEVSGLVAEVFQDALGLARADRRRGFGIGRLPPQAGGGRLRGDEQTWRLLVPRRALGTCQSYESLRLRQTRGAGNTCDAPRAWPPAASWSPFVARN